MLELKIAKFGDGRASKFSRIGRWKFILAHENDELRLYAHGLNESGALIMHKAIVAFYNVPMESVIGGGHINYDNEDLIVYGASNDFGPAPTQLMESFLPMIVAEVEKILPVKKTEVDMHFWKPHLNDEKIKRWADLGYSFN